MIRTWLLPVGLMACATPMFFIERDTLDFLPDPVFSLGHIAIFGMLAYVVGRALKRSRMSLLRQAALILTSAFLLGGSIELIQPYFGRTALWSDVWQNMVGAAAGLLLAHPRDLLRSWWALPVLTMLTLELRLPTLLLWDDQVARQQFPLISNFETRFEHLRWSEGVVVADRARSGERSLRVELQPGIRWPGTALRRGIGDWQGYDTFEFSVHHDDGKPMQLTVAIRDREHSRRGAAYRDRFNRRFELEPGWNDISIPVAEIAAAPKERTLDLGDIDTVIFFTGDVTASRTLHLDALRLSRGPGPGIRPQGQACTGPDPDPQESTTCVADWRAAALLRETLINQRFPGEALN